MPAHKLVSTIRASNDPMPSPAPLWEDVADLDGYSTYVVMRRTIPYVKYHLAAMYKLESGIVGAAPLRIRSAGGDVAGGLTSMDGYKESWDVDNCRASIRRTGLCEAGGKTWLGWIRHSAPLAQPTTCCCAKSRVGA